MAGRLGDAFTSRSGAFAPRASGKEFFPELRPPSFPTHLHHGRPPSRPPSGRASARLYLFVLHTFPYTVRRLIRFECRRKRSLEWTQNLGFTTCFANVGWSNHERSRSRWRGFAIVDGTGGCSAGGKVLKPPTKSRAQWQISEINGDDWSLGNGHETPECPC
jgi:hypothetical protein